MSEPSLHHVGFVVGDIARGIDRFVNDGATVLIAATLDPIQNVYCALLRLADGINIELVAPADPDDSPVTSRLRRGGGLDHVCLAVDDVATALRTEVDHHATVVCSPVHAVTFNRMIAFAYRRSGLLVELMSRQPPRSD